MPFWAVLYCGMIAVSALFAIYAFSSRGPYYIPGQLLSSLFSVMMFLFYYGLFITKPESVLIIIVMFMYILYWECWENRLLFPVIANDTEEMSREGFDLTGHPKVSKMMFLFMYAFIIAISLPLLYIVSNLVMSYI
ncbi:MAG TPA: hypothetical protein EYG35_00310 [Gammaproteobacteria bacterium]|jgi:hypothetical protein|nr:hypothetical protein [Gammaproteobacteria bacterium]